MNNIFENIQFNSDIPIRIFLHNLNYTQNHWHDALEILFMLDGTIHIGIENLVCQLHKEDLIVINPNEMHTTSSSNANLVLVLQISNDWLNKYSAFKGVKISCNSSIHGQSLHMNQIRKLLAQMMWVYNNQSLYFELKLQSYLFELLYQLFTYFKTDEIQQGMGESDKYMPRLSNIIHFIHQNYAQDISLQDLAAKEFLSVSYISRFFKKHIGTSYKEYVIRIRLEHAVKDLLFTDKSIAQLSYDHGFPNTNSFLNAFKETYHVAPSIYRKDSKADFQFLYGSNYASLPVKSNYFELANFDIFKSLYKYLTWNTNTEISNTLVHPVGSNIIHVDLSGATSCQSLSWKMSTSIGKAKDVLNPIIQEQLTMVQSEIGFRSIRFHGLFDDEMMVYREDESGNPLLDFSHIDQTIDFLMSIGLEPFFEIGFMPELLAKNKNTVFSSRKSFISIPNDINKWCFLVERFISHCIDRYGLTKVKEWYFEFWNEPNLTMFWNDSDMDYLSFYYDTFRAIKNVSSDLMVGGPAICNLSDMEDWISRYFDFCAGKNCLPDFFTYHFYIHNSCSDEVYYSYSSGLKRITLSEDADYLSKIIKQMSAVLSDHNYHADKVHITEWNASPSHRDLNHDTLFMASYIVKNILENMASVSSMAFWTISDFIEEFPIPKECFHGGLGVITANGIKKAGYHAFSFLNLLGTNKVTSGPGYYITSDSRGFQILLYNYCHFDPLYCSMDHSGISYKDRYRIFKDSFDKSMQISLTGLEDASYKIIERTVNRSQGSSFDAWVDMGSPEDMTLEHIEYLKSKSTPHYCERIETINGSYILESRLTPHEIKLIEIVNI